MKRFLAIILGVGFLHRLILLGTRQLWIDELMQARIIQGASPAEILARLRTGMDLASPLDFFVQRGITLVLGDSTWALRLHAVVWGTLSIWIFCRIARRLFGDRVAMYSTVLFTFYPLAYHYSQEARPYALLMFLTLLSYDLLLRQILEGNRPWKGWLPIAGVLALLLYTSFLGGLVVMAQFAALILTAGRKSGEPPHGSDAGGTPAFERRPASLVQVAFYALAALAAAALFYPWMRYAWARPQLAPASEILDPKLLLRIIKELGDNSYPVAALLLIGLVVGIRALLRHGRRTSLTWLLTWLLIPIPALLLVEIWAGYFFAIRHILHATPPLLMIAGYGLSYVGEQLSILPRLPYQVSSPAIAFAGLLVLMCAYIGQSHGRSEPVDWRGTAAYLSRSARPGDAITVPWVYPLLEYYDPALESRRVDDLDPGPGSLLSETVMRRIVVCIDKVMPDPCGTFREKALQDDAWVRTGFTGFTVFVRGK